MYGDSKESYLITLIVPNQPYLTQLPNELGISGSFEELCGNSQIIEKVVKDIVVVSKESELIAVFVYFFFFPQQKFMVLLEVLINYSEVSQKKQEHILKIWKFG